MASEVRESEKEMNELRMIMQREARRLLEAGQVDVVIGYARGPFAWTTAPVFVFNKNDCVHLTISSFCTQNLAVYLPKVEGRVAIFAKPCDVRTIVELVQDNQVKRENVKILSFRCPGMLNPKVLEEKGVKPEQAGIVNSKDYPEALYDWCRVCIHREPPDADLRGEPRFLFEKTDYPMPADPSTLADRLEKKTPSERLNFWMEEFSRCIRCKACMHSCPVYYGGGDQLDFIEGTTGVNQPAENLKVVLSFVYSLAGKCTECGACEAACPVDIPLLALHIPMYRKMQQRYGGYEPGLSYDEVSPLLKAEPVPKIAEGG